MSSPPVFERNLHSSTLIIERKRVELGKILLWRTRSNSQTTEAFQSSPIFQVDQKVDLYTK